MKRCQIAPRDHWRTRIEEQGLVFHTTADTGVYWGEGTFYEFTGDEIDAIEAATAELHACCLDAAACVIEERRYAELGIPELAARLVERSWAEEPPSLYARMDLAFGPDGVPKLLEYNADTPTSLLEAGVIQWSWLADCFPDADQFNRVHDALIETWRDLRAHVAATVHFGFVEDVEDEMTVAYLRDTAEQAGLATLAIAMEDLGYDRGRTALVDLEGRPISTLFKLYPWEGLIADPLAPMLPALATQWIEPAWKMVLSNKAILPVLAELFPDHPNILPASRAPLDGPWVKKPLLGREGSNVTIAAPGVDVATGGPYDASGFVYQRYADLGEHAGMRPVIGSWVIGGEPAGIGIRESPGHVTSNTARFVPHVIR
jgi:glutathionylspermidine synthase